MAAIKKSTNSPALTRAANKRAAIIHAGARLMYQKGYHGTSIKDIVDAVEMPKGSFYNYFPSKEEFTIEALEYYTQNRLEEFGNGLKDTSISPVKRIGAIFRNNPDRLSSLDFTPMSFMEKISTELNFSHPEICGIVNNLFDSFRDAVTNCLIEAQRQNEVCKEKNATELAEFILYAWHGAMLHAEHPDDKDTVNEFCNILERDLLV
jgi:TetR/AcrR family transcriptional repressor of nem operon